MSFEAVLAVQRTAGNAAEIDAAPGDREPYESRAAHQRAAGLCEPGDPGSEPTRAADPAVLSIACRLVCGGQAV
jgi:hypothetical protein